MRLSSEAILVWTGLGNLGYMTFSPSAKKATRVD